MPLGSHVARTECIEMAIRHEYELLLVRQAQDRQVDGMDQQTDGYQKQAKKTVSEKKTVREIEREKGEITMRNMVFMHVNEPQRQANEYGICRWYAHSVHWEKEKTGEATLKFTK